MDYHVKVAHAKKHQMKAINVIAFQDLKESIVTKVRKNFDIDLLYKVSRAFVGDRPDCTRKGSTSQILKINCYS